MYFPNHANTHKKKKQNNNLPIHQTSSELEAFHSVKILWFLWGLCMPEKSWTCYLWLRCIYAVVLATRAAWTDLARAQGWKQSSHQPLDQDSSAQKLSQYSWNVPEEGDSSHHTSAGPPNLNIRGPLRDLRWNPVQQEFLYSIKIHTICWWCMLFSKYRSDTNLNCALVTLDCTRCKLPIAGVTVVSR